MFNVRMLRSAMALKGVNHDELAKAIGMSRSTLWRKMNNGNFGLNEAERICDFLDVKRPEDIFFASE